MNKPLGEIYKNTSMLLDKKYGLNEKYKFAIDDNKNALQENYLVDFTKFKKIYQINLKYDFNSGTEHYVSKFSL